MTPMEQHIKDIKEMKQILIDSGITLDETHLAIIDGCINNAESYLYQ